MKDFEEIYETEGEFPDYLKCRYCGQRVERGIVNVVEHWKHCTKSPRVITAKNDFEKKILDSWSINVEK